MTTAAKPAGIDLACALCAEPCPEGARFCCAGCGNVYSILIESGAIREGEDPRGTDLFRRSLELGIISTVNSSVNRRGAPRAFAVPENALAEEKLFHVDGMWCTACAWLIEHVLRKEPGLRQAEVFFTSDLLRVRYCPQYLPAGRIAERLRAIGYTVSPYTGEGRDQSVERRRELLRLGLAGFLWLNVMTLNLSVYLGGGLRHFLPFLVMALATPVVVYAGFPILRLAWIGLRQGVARMEALLAMGIVAAYGYSAVEVFRGGGHIYFDIACAIVTLVLLGRFVERSVKDSAARAITGLYQMLPSKARVAVGGRERFVAVSDLVPGDVFIVKAGERVPADGLVMEGESHVDESLLTGESRPVSRRTGDRVTGGSLNTSGVLQVRVTAVGKDSTLARIVKAVETALSSRSDIERLADRVSRVFVPCVIALAVVSGLISALGGLNPGEAVMRAVTVLVIACPCALGIATPLAVTAAVGGASRQGILISDPRALEAMRRVDTVLLDKTGTVTEGTFRLLKGNPDHISLVAAVERYSEHPLGCAIVAQASEIPAAFNVQVLKGRGVCGETCGKLVFCGNRRLLAEFGLQPGAEIEACAAAEEARGNTAVFYGWEREVRGVFVFGDTLRADARRFAEELHSRGMRIIVVSGDSRGTVQSVASTIAADEWFAEVLPEGKQKLVADLQSRGMRVLMVGDGVNDGPALAQADLGIAMGSATALAMKAANVILMNNRLLSITNVFGLARRTTQIVKQNLFWAFFYNVAAISFALTGRLNPVLAAGAMVTSSAFVVWNSSRLQ